MLPWRVLIALWCLPCSVVAQFNDTTEFYVNYASTGIVNKTNDNRSYVLNNNLRFSFYRKDVSLNTSHGFIFGKQQQSLVNRDLTSSVDFNIYKGLPHTYYWGLGSFEKSLSLRIHQRLQAGLGIGYNVVDRKNAIVNLSDGILYEKSELFDKNENADVVYETLRNSFRLKFRFVVNERLTFDGTNFLQHSLEDRHDYIVRSYTGLSFKIMRWLNFTTALNYNKMSRTERENLLLNFGLTVERYF